MKRLRGGSGASVAEATPIVLDPATSVRRRRPSGEPPPLPRPLRKSGKVMLWLTGAIVLTFMAVAIPGVNFSSVIDRFDTSIAVALEGMRFGLGNTVFGAINDVLSSIWTLGVLRWATIIVLFVYKRFRHFFVFLGSILMSGWITVTLASLFIRARPFTVEIIGDWQGPSVPSLPVAALAATLVGMTYSLVVEGAPRGRMKYAVWAILLTFGFARVYLGVDHFMDVVAALVFGVTIPLIAFRFFTPNDVFPVNYSRRRAAHLDLGGARGEAIKTALSEQLGIQIVEMKPFGLEGSGGSTPIRLKVEGQPVPYLFAKLYAANHLRADRWYKLGRTLLYGRLEDESSFSSVRRLVQYEDYILRIMRDAGLRTPTPYGFVEITPEREYLLVSEFIDGGVELTEAEVNDQVIDSALQVVRNLWDAGIAHRDIKPSNLLVRDNEVFLIDVAFAEVRPSAWRQAVDLANVMIVLALRTDAERVYERALRFFTPDDVAEAFAATKGVTMPSQSRAMLRKDSRNLVDAFRKLAPSRPPIKIQTWSIRRVGMTAGFVVLVLIAYNVMLINLRGAGLVPAPGTSQSAYAVVSMPPSCDPLEQNGEAPLLLVQAVPTASRVPCIAGLPVGWSFSHLDVRNGSGILYIESDRAVLDPVEVILERSCDTEGASPVPTDEAGTKRFEKIHSLEPNYSATRYYLFDGGCVTYELNFEGSGRTALANEVSLALGFMSRDDIAQLLRDSSGLEL